MICFTYKLLIRPNDKLVIYKFSKIFFPGKITCNCIPKQDFLKVIKVDIFIINIIPLLFKIFYFKLHNND